MFSKVMQEIDKIVRQEQAILDKVVIQLIFSNIEPERIKFYFETDRLERGVMVDDVPVFAITTMPPTPYEITNIPAITHFSMWERWVGQWDHLNT